MLNVKWTTASLLMAFVVVSASQSEEQEVTSERNVMVGDDVTLECGDNSSDLARRFWKKDETLIVGNNDINGVDRISLVNGSAILRIMKVEVDDEGHYKCIVYTQPRFIHVVKLQVTEIVCEAPVQPVGGGYNSEAHGPKFKTGDAITYHCTRGYRLIGHSNRICTAGTTNGWDTEEPYCEPEYIGHLMKKLDDIEQRIETVENKTLQMDNKISAIDNNISTMRNNVSAIDDKVLTMDKRISKIDEKLSHMDNAMSASNHSVSAIDDKVSAMDNNMSEMGMTLSATNSKVSVLDSKISNMESRLSSVAANISSLETFNRPLAKIRDRLVACTNGSDAIEQDVMSKCLTMKSSVRGGRSVSEYEWVIENFNSKVTSTRWAPHYSTIFYHTVPGYKFKLRADIDSDTEIRVFLYLQAPGEYDDQMKWPFSQKYDLTVMKSDGTEALHKSFSGLQSTCKLNRPTTPTEFNCHTSGTGWSDVWRNKKHILKDGSTVIKFYMYN